MEHLLANTIDVICWLLVLAILVYWGFWGYEKSDDRPALVRRWVVSAVLIFIIVFFARMHTPFKIFLIIPFALVLAFIWVSSVTQLLIRPLTGAFDGGADEVERKPFYFAAEGKRRKGLYDQAIAEVRNQLEMFPGDYEGYVKLATIQMENLHDLPAAEATINEFVDIPGRAPQDVVASLHLLADWQLQFGRNAAGATETLTRIEQLYPGTPFDHAAKQRLAHLVTADDATRARYERKFVVQQREKDLGLKTAAVDAGPVVDPATRAAEFVKQLEAHPFDTETREKLAILYAEEFQRLDLAADQLEQLIALPAEPPRHVARWLNLLATLHIKYAHNAEAAEAALRRIGQRFPGGAQAMVAAQRLAALGDELKANQTPAVKSLGNYEKDLGLKNPGHF